MPCSVDPARHNYIDYLGVEFDTQANTPEPEATPEPEFTCDDVRRDLKRIMKVPRLQGRLGRIAIEMRRLAQYHRAIDGAIQRGTEAKLAREAQHRRAIEAIVTDFLGDYNHRNKQEHRNQPRGAQEPHVM